MPAWSKGRIVLVGDAAFCPSLLAGEGAGFALAGAYLLAGELQRASGDHIAAYRAYEQRFRPFIERKQKAAQQFASSFAVYSLFSGQQLADAPLRNRSIRTTGLSWLRDCAFQNDRRHCMMFGMAKRHKRSSDPASCCEFLSRPG